MKIFEVQTNLISFLYPVIKIMISTAIVILCVFRRNLVSISAQWINVVISLISFVLVILCILVIYISIGEIFHTISNRNCHHYLLNDTAQYSLDDVIALAQKEDIVEIELLTSEGLVKVGSSSDNAYADALFTDKQYYIGGNVYTTIEAFTEALLSISSNGVLYVLAVDGIMVK